MLKECCHIFEIIIALDWNNVHDIYKQHIKMIDVDKLGTRFTLDVDELL